MSTPPPKPDHASSPEGNMALKKRLDEMLLEIEVVEPGTLDPAVLPEMPKQDKPKPTAAQAKPSAEAEIDALLNAPPVQGEPAPVAEAGPVAEAAPVASEPEPEAKTPEQADMLAALNSALQGLDAEAPAAEAAAPPSEPTDEPASMEDKLQAEIAALMNAEPEATETPAAEAAVQASATEAFDEFDGLEGSFETPEKVAASTDAVQPSARTEDLIAQEIEGLLNTDHDEPATAASADSAIDELDKMLAQEIDADDDLAGDFQSVEDLTAGIQVPDAAASTVDDEHAATARDVAAELDSQPEDLPDATFEPITATAPADEDPFAVLDEAAATKEKNAKVQQLSAALKQADWAHWLEVGKANLLNACYLINWPARRFLSNEWRATLGLISLTFATTSTIFLFVVLLFG